MSLTVKDVIQAMSKSEKKVPALILPADKRYRITLISNEGNKTATEDVSSRNWYLASIQAQQFMRQSNDIIGSDYWRVFSCVEVLP